MTISNYVQKRWQLITLFALCLIILSSHSLYVVNTRQYPQMDEQHYMDMAVQFYRLLQNPTLQTPIQMIQYIPFRQPGYSLLILPFLLIFGIENSYKIALLVNGICYVVSVVTVFFLGKFFFNKTISLLASILFAFYGWNLFYLHFTYSETVTTTFVLMSLFFLLKSNSFRQRKFSLLFAICFGYGLLIRWVTWIFIVGPLLLVLFQGFRGNKKKQVLRNIFLVLLISLAVAIWPYIFNINAFWRSYVKDQLISGPLWEIVPESRRAHFSLQSAAYYFKVFEQITIYLFIPFITGLILALVRWKKYILLLLAFLFPYILFSFMTIIKDDRYIIPIYPLISLLTCVTIISIKNKNLRIIITVFLVTVSIYNFLGASWGFGLLGKEGLQSVLIPMPIGHPRRIHFTTLVWPPTKEYSNAHKIMAALDEDIRKRNIRKPYILQLFSYQPVDNALYALNRYTKKEMYSIDNFVGAGVDSKIIVEKRLREAFEKADYVLIKSGLTIDNYFPEHNYQLLQAMNKVLLDTNWSITNDFEKLTIIPIPLDKSSLSIYRQLNRVDKKYVDEFIYATINTIKI